MSEIVLTRRRLTKRSTIGTLDFGDFRGFSLEDFRRPASEPKVPGATAIPAGRYKVAVTYSNRFQRMMPILLDVPGFTGIRIHSGNTDADTSGCILVGLTKGTDYIGESRAAYGQLFPAIQEAVRNGDLYISIVECWE